MEKTLTLSPIPRVAPTGFVNVVLVETENTPLTLDSDNISSYKSSPSYFPAYCMLSTIAEA